MRSVGQRTSEAVVGKAHHRGQIVIWPLWCNADPRQAQPFDAKIGILKQLLKLHPTP